MAKRGKNEPISSTELILQTWRKIKHALRGRQIFFKYDPSAEIANDSDWHRTRTGDMRYTHVAVVRAAGQAFLLARGIKSGSYPADPYDSDLTVYPLGKGRVMSGSRKFMEEAEGKLESSTYFSNSLVMTMASGDIALNEGSRFFAAVKSLLPKIAEELIANDSEVDNEYLSLSTLQPIVTRSAKYHPDAPKKLALALVGILKESRF